MDYYGKYAPTRLLLTNNVGIVMLLLCWPEKYLHYYLPTL